jgi:CysZ protein
VSNTPQPPAARGCAGWPADLLTGATYPLRALVVLNRNRSLWGYVGIPLLVNIVLGVLLYASMLTLGLRSINEFIIGLPEWAAVVGVLLQVLLVIGLLILIGFVLLRFGVVLGAPWYSQLSEELEAIQLGIRHDQTPLTVASVLRDVGHALSFELKKLLLLVAVGLPLLMLSLFPITGWLSPLLSIVWLALAALIACLDFFDFALSRRRLRFRAKLGIIRAMLPASGSFGVVCVGLISVPFLNLLAIPLCATAGTLFFCDRIWPTLPPASEGRPAAR